MIAAGVTAGAFALKSTDNNHSASQEQASAINLANIPEAQPAKAIVVHGDDVSLLPREDISYKYKASDGSEMKCPEKVTVTVEGSDDTLSQLSRFGVSERNLIYEELLNANLDYNQRNRGLTVKDYTSMQFGDQFDVLKGCELTSPLYAWPGEDTGFFDVSKQSNDSSCQYDYDMASKKVSPPDCMYFGPDE